MVSEEIIIERERLKCIVDELVEMLEVNSYFQFKLRFSEKDNEQTLIIVPHAKPVEITLRRQ